MPEFKKLEKNNYIWTLVLLTFALALFGFLNVQGVDYSVFSTLHPCH